MKKINGLIKVWGKDLNRYIYKEDMYMVKNIRNIRGY